MINLNLEQQNYNYVSVYNDLIVDDPSLTYNVTTRLASIGFQRIKQNKGKNSLAPLGRFWGVRFIYGTLFYNPTEFTESGNPFTEEHQVLLEEKYKSFELSDFGWGLTLGARTMLKEPVMISYGVDFYGFSLIPEYKVYSTNPSARYDIWPSDFDAYLSFSAKVFVGIEVLLF